MIEPLPINIDEKLNILKEKFSWVDFQILENLSKIKNLQYICYSPSITLPYIENGKLLSNTILMSNMMLTSKLDKVFCIYTITNDYPIMIRGSYLHDSFNTVPNYRDNLINDILN